MATGISWCDKVWNPVTGCSKVSEGCRNCYAAALAPRLAAMGQKGYTTLPWTAKNAAENVKLHPDRLEKPLRWRKPHRVFVNSMSDLFHEHVPDEFIALVFAVMYVTPRHTFQILTKRPERMAELLNSPEFRYAVEYEAGRRVPRDNRQGRLTVRPDADTSNVKAGVWPLPNVWLGISVEDQRAADERIWHLLRTPAAVRFLSCEPLIGPVDLRKKGCPVTVWDGPYRYRCGLGSDGDICAYHGRFERPVYDGIHWVIAGGESGPHYRPLDLDWMRSLRDQCAAAGVAFFGKQAAGTRNEMPLPPDLQIRQFPETSGEPSGAGAGS